MKAFSRNRRPFPTSGREGDLHRENFYSTFSRSILRTFGTREVWSHIIVFIRRVVLVIKGAAVSEVFGVELIDFRI